MSECAATRVFGSTLLLAAAGLAGCATTTAPPTAAPACPALAAGDPWQAHPRSPGVQVAYLVGQPAEPGFFKYRLQFPAGFAVAAHQHSADLHMTVLCGAVQLQRGQSMREQQVAIGDHAEFAAGEVHAEASRDGAVLEITGIGPVATQPAR